MFSLNNLSLDDSAGQNKKHYGIYKKIIFRMARIYLKSRRSRCRLLYSFVTPLR